MRMIGGTLWKVRFMEFVPMDIFALRVPPEAQ